MDLGGLVKLASVACVNVPANIAFERGPPEVVGDGAVSGIKAFMAELVMSGADESEALLE